MSAAATAIPLFDYVEQYQAIEEETLRAIRGVLASGSLILGPRVRQFEEEFVDFLHGSGHGLGVGNGTDALAIALRALGVGPGDEVITAANTAIPTASAIRMTGAVPVLCDVDPQTLLMHPAAVEARITRRTRAIVPVHLFGNAVDMPRMVTVARHHNLAVVEDCAQSCGTTWNGQHTGTFGDVGCFSFYPTKNLGAFGDGGFCFTRDAKLHEAMRQIRTYGCPAPNDARREGVNSRLDELQAAVLSVKLQHLPAYLARRRSVAATYREHLDSSVVLPSVPEPVDHSYHLFVIQTERREVLIERLDAEGIGWGIHYPTPIHRLPAFDFLGQGPRTLPIVERAASRILTLPCYPELRHDSVRQICRAVNDVHQSHV